MLKESYDRVLEQIDMACQKCGRAPSSVKLLAVSKFHSFEDMLGLYNLGQTAFGESYIQEALPKIEAFMARSLSPSFHFIGHVQSRKAPKVFGRFKLIHSVDSEKLALSLEKAGLSQEKTQDILLEVSIACETQKSGVAYDKLMPLAAYILEHCPHLNLCGLMCIPPLEDSGEKARPYFAKLAELKVSLEQEFNISLQELSMGMSDDFPWAIYEGATIIRVGTALFGPRNYQ